MATTSTTASRGPTQELGYASYGGPSVFPWRMLVDNQEFVPDLRFPRSIDTFERMRTDPKVEGLLLACTLPVIRYTWTIDPNGARPEVYRPLADDMGLNIKGEEARPRLRNRGKFKHEHHMWQAMLALAFGFHPFEIVGHYPDGTKGLWRLAKVGPRPPWTISRVGIDEHGDLFEIEQRYGIDTPPIPASSLIPYVWRMEGSNWFGRSLLRASYKPWLIKDRVLRIAAMAIERNGIGVPVMEMNTGATEEEIKAGQELAMAYRAGDIAGAAVVNGKLTLQGVKGNTAPVMEFLRYLDEQFSHSTLTQFMDLGSTKHGSRALGGEFVDFFMNSQETTGLWYAETTNDYLIERWVDINFGAAEIAPKLVFERNEDPALAVAPLIALIEAGAVTLDTKLENQIRDRFGLTPREAGDPAPEVKTKAPALIGPTSLASAPVLAADPSLPDKPLRRQPYEHEIASGVNIKALDEAWTAEFASLAETWKGITRHYIDTMHDTIAAGASLMDLANIVPEVHGHEELFATLTRMATVGRDAALAELKSQGLDMAAPDAALLEDALKARADAVALWIAERMGGHASRQALRMAGTDTKAADVAAGVRDYLDGMKFAEVNDALKGIVQNGLNAGRAQTFGDDQLPTGTRFFANEILDDRTCTPCVDIDSREYASMAEASNDYPVGGFVDCLGLDKCRGLIVAILPSEVPASVQDSEGA